MLKTIASVALSLVSATAPAQKEVVKPPLAEQESGTVIVRLLPHRVQRTDGDYAVETGEADAQQRYDALKAALDERFAHMFELKAALERNQELMAAKWEEYYALHEKYNRELKKIIAAWVTDSNYLQQDR